MASIYLTSVTQVADMLQSKLFSKQMCLTFQYLTGFEQLREWLG